MPVVFLFLILLDWIVYLKGICFQAIGEVATIDLPDPQIQAPGDAIVKVSVAGLCGSDLHSFFGREQGLDVGTVMGHEFVGTIVELGSEAKFDSQLEVGDRVFAPFSTSCGKCFFCRNGLTSRCEVGQLFGWRQNQIGLHGCQSEYVRVPLAAGTLMKLPAGISDTDALLLGDNFSTGYFCAEMAGVQAGRVYVVIGCGTVGQLCVLAARKMGASTIFALDPLPARRQQVEKLGAIGLPPDDSAVQQIKQATCGRGADAVMELVGLPAAQDLAYRVIRPGGVMSVIGCHCTPEFAFSPVDAYDKNLTYRTGRCPTRFYMETLTSKVADGTYDLNGFVTHRFGILESVQAYDVFSNRRDGCVKAVIEMN